MPPPNRTLAMKEITRMQEEQMDIVRRNKVKERDEFVTKLVHIYNEWDMAHLLLARDILDEVIISKGDIDE